MIGRRAETESLTRALATAGARVQLVGPPGIGKSTLARHVTADRKTIWVELEPIEPLGFVEAVAQRLDVPSSEEAVIGGLSEIEILGLDGAEGLVEIVERFLDDWRTAVPELKVVVTSQRRLNSAVTLEVGPLLHEDAVALFLKRAAAVSATLNLEEEQEAVAELSRRLDGWPLAIELAASRLRLFSPRELLEESPIEVLYDASKAGRHSSLKGVLEASLSLLSEEARLALFRVAVFRNGFDRDAFVQVSGGNLQLLENLLDASLLRWRVTGEGRVYTLLGPVRAYALEHTPPDGHHIYAEVVLDRAEAAVAIELSSRAGEAIRALRRWSADLQGLLAGKDQIAARAAIALSVLAKANGPTRTAIEWIASIPRESLPRRMQQELDLRQATLHIRSDAPPETLALVDWPDNPAVLTIKSLLLMCQAKLEAAAETARQAHTMAVNRKSELWTLESTFALGVILLLRGDPVESRNVLMDGLEQTRHVDRPNLEGLMLKHCALVERALGLPLRSRILKLERAVALHRSTNAQRLEAMATGILAVSLMDAEDDKAPETIEQARVQARRTGEVSTLRAMNMLSGMAALDSGDTSKLREILTNRAPDDGWSLGTRKMLEGLLAHFSGLGDEAQRMLRGSTDELVAVGAQSDANLSACMLSIVQKSPPPPRPQLPETATDVVAWEIAHHTVAGTAIPPDVTRAAQGCMENRVMLQVANQSSGAAVAYDGSWFRTPDGSSTDLSRKRVLKRVLAAIVQHDGPISQNQLLTTAWKGERMSAESGRARVHVAISELRKLGLRGVLVTVDHEDGAAYRIRARIVAD